MSSFLNKQSAGVKFAGGSVLGLTQTTILLGKGQNITDIDYENISINPLVFDYPLIKEKVPYDIDNNLYNTVISIDNKAIISPDEVSFNYQKKLIPDSSIIIDDDNNINVDFRLSGWSNINNNYITTNYNNIGIGISNPLANIHIHNNNASIIIDNIYNNFKLNYNDTDYFVFGNYNNIDNIHTEQLKIHKYASLDSIIINENNSIILNSNIHITGKSYLSPNIYIDNTYIINWLSNNGLASYDYVKDNLITTSNTVLKGIGKEITELDYNNITYNKLNFNYPLNISNNNISIDLNIISGWSNTNSNIYTISSNVGIGTSLPLANLHIGSMTYSNTNDNDGSLILSKSSINLNKNFKFGYDNNFNFILGDFTRNNWTSFISINSNVNINTNLIINNPTITLNKYNITYNNTNLILGNNSLFINNNGSIGVGTLPNSSYKLIIDGHTKINSNLEVRDVFINNCISCNITLNTLTANNITSANINNTNLITSVNLNNSLAISTTTLNSTTINNTNTINTNIFNCTNTITTNNFNTINANINNLLTSSSINTSNLISSNITTINNINTSNINTTTINSTDINTNTINATTVRTSFLNTIETITTSALTSRTANITDITATNNITSLNMNCTRTITTSNINTTTITSPNINNTTLTSTTINANSITSRNITATNNITTNNSINGTNLFINNIICYNNVGIGTTNPRGFLHLNANKIAGTNSSILFTNLNDISIKIGYINNNFILGTYNIDTDSWINQFSINANAPANTFNINSLGNIGIGTINTNDYKFNINGTINATNLFKNGEEMPTLTILNQQITNSLVPYITSTQANNLYTKYTYVDNLNYNTNNNIYDIVAHSFEFNDNIYTSELRFPTNNSLYTINVVQNIDSYYNNSIYGFKETFVEQQLLENQSYTYINYEIYYSSGDKYKNALFNYSSTQIGTINWKDTTYNNQGIFDNMNNNYSTDPNNFYNFPSSAAMPDGEIIGIKKENYRGEFLIFKNNNAFIFKKFRFYISRTNVSNNVNFAPGNWICCGSIDGINWTYLKDASSINSLTRLTPGSYQSYNDTLLYYEKSFNNYNEYNFIGFIFYSIVNFPGTDNQGRTLKLSRVELFGRFKINPVYVSSINLNSTLRDYAKITDTNSKLSKDIVFAYPIQFKNNVVSLNSNYILMLTDNNDTPQFRTYLSSLINNYINSYTNVWKTDENNPANYYFNGSCIGIGLSNVNQFQVPDLKLNVDGTIQTTRINANIISGNGNEITNINYNNITLNKPDLKNINNWNNSTLNNTTNCYANFNGNIGIGYVYNTSLTHKLNIVGSIHSSANIIATNFIENGVNLIDKYITTNFVNLNFLSNAGGIINGSIGIGTSANTYRLNINGNLNSTSIFENGTNIASKYITIQDTFNNYISKLYGGTITNQLFISSNVGIGTTLIYDNNILSINGSVFSTSNISASNFIENNIKLIDKYLTISYASNNYFSNIGGIINGSIGINTSISSIYKLNVNGSIYSSNDIIGNNFIENGINLIDKYLTITYASNNYLSNINPTVNGDIYCSGSIRENGILLSNKYLSQDGGNIIGNIGIGTNPNNSYKLNVNGSIYSSNDIIGNNFIENGMNLIDKYLTITYASNNYLSNINPIVNGDIYCSGSIRENGILLSNKYLSQDGGNITGNIGIGTNPNNIYKLNVNGSIYSSNDIIGNNFFENGINLNQKYLTITNASNNYLSNINPITDYLTVYSNIGIGIGINTSYKLNVNGDIYCSGSIHENGILLNNKYLSQDGGNITGNIGIGTNPNNIYKLNVNGSIYSSNDIIGNNFFENGINLKDKYLTISNASNNYLSNINPITDYLTVYSNIGIGIGINTLYKLNVNGDIYCNSNIYCIGSIRENGILLNNKYLSQDGGNITGNIGIGTNPNNIYKLNVNGSIYSSNDIIGSNLIGSNIICDNIIQKGSNLNDIYVKISDLPNYNTNTNININNPNIQKKVGIKFQCTKEIILNDNTYYLFNINISNYVKTKNDYIDGNPYRIFNIKCFSTTAVFRNNLNNKPPNILQYDIYMSHLLNLDPPSLNICAIGFPSNYYLNKITAGDIFILKTNNYNYLSVLSKYPNANISCIITDFLF